mmetsp:Transcript_5210/g.11641  ORF Transcript_5210/g.11641 Transcript_5210/m.11641 type:complete len:203 (+) Transcript_5210:218-826(+)
MLDTVKRILSKSPSTRAINGPSALHLHSHPRRIRLSSHPPVPPIIPRPVHRRNIPPLRDSPQRFERKNRVSCRRINHRNPSRRHLPQRHPPTSHPLPRRISLRERPRSVPPRRHPICQRERPVIHPPGIPRRNPPTMIVMMIPMNSFSFPFCPDMKSASGLNHVPIFKYCFVIPIMNLVPIIFVPRHVGNVPIIARIIRPKV